MQNGKVVIAGAASSGKTCLIQRYIENKFSSTTSATLTADFFRKEFVIDGKTVGLSIWDTAG